MKDRGRYVLVAFALLVVSCAPHDERIQIGVIAPLTGGAYELGQHMQQGLDLANEHLNDSYSLVYEDDGCDATKGVTAARKLVTVDGVRHIIGPLCTPPYVAVAPFLNEEGVSFMHTSNAGPVQLEAAGALGIPGMSTTTGQEMETLTVHIRGEGMRSMGVFVWNQEWALTHRNSFVEQFTDLGGAIVFDERFDLEDKDFRTALLRLKRSGAEGVYVVALNPQTAEIIRQLRSFDSELAVFTQYEVETEDFLKAVGEAAEGMAYAYPLIDSERPETRRFTEAYRERHGKAPPYYAFVGYDSLILYDSAIRKCGMDAACATDTILHGEFETAIGTTMFADGQVNRDFEIRTIENGLPTRAAS